MLNSKGVKENDILYNENFNYNEKLKTKKKDTYFWYSCLNSDGPQVSVYVAIIV